MEIIQKVAPLSDRAQDTQGFNYGFKTNKCKEEGIGANCKKVQRTVRA